MERLTRKQGRKFARQTYRSARGLLLGAILCYLYGKLAHPDETRDQALRDQAHA